MSEVLFNQDIDQVNHQESMANLERGKILFFPQHYFAAVDTSLFSADLLDAHHKNISYDYKKGRLGVTKQVEVQVHNKLEQLLCCYAEFAYQLIEKTLPSYAEHLQWGRTSFRPAQIKGRVSSKRKDDTRLHVDSFSATPVNGLRILRVFCNINPQQEPRVWHVGEPFAKVLERFAPKIPAYNKWVAHVLKMVKATKTLRSAYDHYMLHLHDTMKMDDQYQQQVVKTQVDFPAQSTWIVFTDHVSHAALSGQYLLEQTFYLPVDKMNSAELSPLHTWQKLRPELDISAVS